MPSGAADPDVRHPYRWVVLFGLWLMYASFGLSIASLAPLVGRIGSDLGITYGAMGAVLGAWQLIYIGSALPLGALLDRIGVAVGLTASAGVMAFSLAARGGAVDETTLFLAVAVFGLGGPMVSIGAPKLIALWFEGADRGMAMGIYITGPSIGGIAAYALTNGVLMPWLDGNWRAVLWTYAAFVLSAGLVWWLISRHPEARLRDGRTDAMSKAGTFRAFTEIAGLRTVQIVLLMSIGIFMLNHGLSNWLPEILTAKGMTPAVAGLWAAVPTAVGVLGSLTIPRFATPERRVTIMAGLFVAAGLATLMLHLAPGIGLGTGLIMLGIARSSMMTVAILLLMEAPGVPPERAGMAGGMFFTVAEIGGVTGPLSIGLISEASGGFTAPLIMLTAVVVMLGLLLIWLRLIERGLAGGAPSR